ncbi:hypothetical protein EIN_500610 [Entamoeba invadens IP1]|uniref:Uncharacterized protein n=1 Tax=Entamoeba invadens IP1 TaxID=370355 RepID=L7FJE0_ENTIV|nr:hypothetical protein EIN_500610 [Entamoeba invadens IP1]ELP83963.1 hypothetical protein EIN_500610 [Entamoeba invadens IP1]|eukprot:XP_004183309.1 hypothetical protein EIN_500610 [Entamoeba invadens IP1]
MLFIALFVALSTAVLKEKIANYEVELPSTLLGPETVFRIYTYSKISTRLYPSFDGDNNYYVGYTDKNLVGTVIKIKSHTNEILRTDKFSGLNVRGLAAEADGTYGVLLWDRKTETISFKKVNKDGTVAFTKALDLRSGFPSRVENTGSNNGYKIGDSRVNYGNGLYHVYTHTHSDPDQNKVEHEGDVLFTISDAGVVSKIWNWGCSHMLSGLQGYNSQTQSMIHLCDSDAYPGFGMFAENDKNKRLYSHIANMGGYSGGELGGVAENGDGWLLIMNSITPEAGTDVNAGAPNGVQDIGVVSIGKDKKRSKVTFIKQSDTDKTNGCIAKYGEKFLVGYMDKSKDYYLGTIDASVKMTNPFEKVTEVTGWGDRDDSFRTLSSGNIFWVRAPDNNGNKLIISEFNVAGGVVPDSENKGFMEVMIFIMVVLLFAF